MSTTGDRRRVSIFGDDTSPEAERIMIEGFRRMSGAEKLRRVSELCRLTNGLALADIRRQHPTSGERENLLRLAARRMDPAILKRLVGWSPDEAGD